MAPQPPSLRRIPFCLGHTRQRQSGCRSLPPVASPACTRRVSDPPPYLISTRSYWATKGNELPMTTEECMLSSAASMAVGFTEDTTPEVR